jgi:Fe-S cluster assembly ATPase SufC
MKDFLVERKKRTEIFQMAGAKISDSDETDSGLISMPSNRSSFGVNKLKSDAVITHYQRLLLLYRSDYTRFIKR